jgi:predicted acetyltransferase
MKIVPGTNYSKSSFDWSVTAIEQAVNRKQPTHLGSKDGLDLFYIKDQYKEHFIYLKDGNEYIGMIRLGGDRYGKEFGYRVGAVYLCNKYRGRGLGTVLYLGAINRLKRIHSSTNIGEQAVRAWRSVAKYHPLKIYDHYEEKVDYTWGARKKNPVIKNYGSMNKGYDCFIMVASA